MVEQALRRFETQKQFAAGRTLAIRQATNPLPADDQSPKAESP
jgi:hypothetical protein